MNNDTKSQAMGKKSITGMNHNELQREVNSLRRGQDQRAEGLNMRESELDDRQTDLDSQLKEIETSRQQLLDAALPSRVSIDESVAPSNLKGHDSKSIRSPIESGKKFPNIQPYLERHQDKKLLWVNDYNGDVQRWIDEGAEPVPVLHNKARVFEGITDKAETKWVRVVAGEIQGVVIWVYLMMIDPDEYHRIRIAPQQRRQELIRRAMAAGGDRSGYAGNVQLPTYSPTLSIGGQGINISQETIRR